MISIGEFSKLSNVTARALRIYEDKGLIVSQRGNVNQYRYYKHEDLKTVERILCYKNMGFSLEEVGQLLRFSEQSLSFDIEKKLENQHEIIENEITKLLSSKKEIKRQLSVTATFNKGKLLTSSQRRVVMEMIKEEVLKNLEVLSDGVKERHLDFLLREDSFIDTEKNREFLKMLKQVVSYAKSEQLSIGPGRGHSPSSLILYALGVNSVDPTQYGLIPEMFSREAPEIWLDVEYEKGQKFVDYCKKITLGSNHGQIEAFKCPFLDIINNVHTKLGKKINYDKINDDDPIVLFPFQNGEVEMVFRFDFSSESLISILPPASTREYRDNLKISEYLKDQKIHNFLDVINICSLWRPHCQENIDRINRYKAAKVNTFEYSFLSPIIKKKLKSNFGLIIYHEDIVSIVHEYTGWNFYRCNAFRKTIMKDIENDKDREKFIAKSSEEVFNLLKEESKYSFSKAHIIAFSRFIKQTAVLKSLHRDIYYEEISKWENRHGLSWDEVGYVSKGISLMQN